MTAGLPIWITEMDFAEGDVNQRADGYEDALRLYFSRPEIDGILLWGFWNEEHSKPDAALFDGPDLTVSNLEVNNMSKLQSTFCCGQSEKYNNSEPGAAVFGGPDLIISQALNTPHVFCMCSAYLQHYNTSHIYLHIHCKKHCLHENHSAASSLFQT